MAYQTKQKRTIMAILDEAGGALSATEVWEEARQSLKNTALATVYRTLQKLAEEGYANRVELPGQPSRFERRAVRHHHHFICNVCGKVFHTEGCPGNLEKFAPEGFHVAEHELVLYGECKTCLDDDK